LSHDYLKRLAFHGDPAKALAAASAALSAARFKVNNANSSQLDAMAKGGLPNKARNPLRMFTHFRVRVTAGSVEITGTLTRFNAELGGVQALTVVIEIAAVIAFTVAWLVSRQLGLLLAAGIVATIAAATPFAWHAIGAKMRRTAHRAADALGQTIVAGTR
jgi:hypothetical protein